jgi:predicted membrane protein
MATSTCGLQLLCFGLGAGYGLGGAFVEDSRTHAIGSKSSVRAIQHMLCYVMCVCVWRPCEFAAWTSACILYVWCAVPLGACQTGILGLPHSDQRTALCRGVRSFARSVHRGEVQAGRQRGRERVARWTACCVDAGWMDGGGWRSARARNGSRNGTREVGSSFANGYSIKLITAFLF